MNISAIGGYQSQVQGPLRAALSPQAQTGATGSTGNSLALSRQQTAEAMRPDRGSMAAEGKDVARVDKFV
jgi:hypothetical protein